MSDVKAVQYYSKLTVMPQVINTRDLILLLDFLSTRKTQEPASHFFLCNGIPW